MGRAVLAPPFSSDREDAPLRSDVEQPPSSLTAEAGARTQMQQQMQAQIDQAAAAAKTAQAQNADAAAAVIQSIPTTVAAEIDKVKPKTDGLYFKGVKITPGGFLETANVYRQRNLGNDISTALNTIPYPVTRSGHVSEDRFTPRQSRSPPWSKAIFVEFDAVQRGCGLRSVGLGRGSQGHVQARARRGSGRAGQVGAFSA